jgi:hypothetical protein
MQAEEKASSVMTAVSSTTLSGYVDTTAQWNFGTGNARLPDYKFGGPSKADGFNFNVVQLRIDKPLDESEWAAGYRVDLWAGPDANTLATQSSLSTGSSDFAVRQAYVALRAPVGNGLDFKMGVFDSPMGYESVEAGLNPNYTRSYGHTIEPQTLTGLQASYRFNDTVSASAGIANTLGPTINGRASAPFVQPPDATQAESFKTYFGTLALTAPESMGFLAGSTLYGGIANGYNESYGANETSYYVGATVATPVKGLRLGVAFDDLAVHDLDGETWAVGGYASYQATEKLSLHLRGEYLRDRGEQKFFVDSVGPTNPDKTLGITGTIQYDLWKNVISRLEVRWDHSLSGVGIWGGTDPESLGTLKNEVMMLANITYKF